LTRVNKQGSKDNKDGNIPDASDNRLILGTHSDWSSDTGSARAELRDEIDMAISKCIED